MLPGSPNACCGCGNTSRTMPRSLCMKHLVPCIVDDAGGVLATVLQQQQRVVDQLVDRGLRDDADDAAHGSFLQAAVAAARSSNSIGRSVCQAASSQAAPRECCHGADRASGETPTATVTSNSTSRPRNRPKPAPSRRSTPLSGGRSHHRPEHPGTDAPDEQSQQEDDHDRGAVAQRGSGVADPEVRLELRRQRDRGEPGDEPARQRHQLEHEAAHQTDQRRQQQEDGQADIDPARSVVHQSTWITAPSPAPRALASARSASSRVPNGPRRTRMRLPSGVFATCV